MSDYSSVFYKNNFLSQVIVRIDFLQFVSNDLIFHESIEKEILKNFPLREKEQIMRFNSIDFTINSNGDVTTDTNEQVKEGAQREYYSIDKKNKIIISNMYLIFEINNYSKFNEHKNWFQSIINSLFEVVRLSIKRTGIRYINLFDSENIRLQKKFFSNEIASALLIKIDTEDNELHLVRSMHMTEYSIENMIINFRFGMYNTDYPNPLKKNDFVLDYDCFTNDLIENSHDIIRIIDSGHREIQSLYEASITDSLREIMQK